MADRQKILSDLRKSIEEKIAEYNDALKDKKPAAEVTAIETELKEIEADYSKEKQCEVFDTLGKADDPVVAAVTQHSYLTLGHRAKREEGVVMGLELVTDKVRQIDLVALCKYCHLPTDWQYKVERFNQLLACRAATELKMTKTQIKKICDSFYMNELSRKIDLGETPTSNTQICKQLQQVLDSVVFLDNGKGTNVYRVNSHDVAYLLMCYTKRGKKVLSVAVAKNAYMHRLFVDIAHRIVTGKAYDLEYRMVSADKVPETKAKAAAKTAKATETVIEKK